MNRYRIESVREGQMYKYRGESLLLTGVTDSGINYRQANGAGFGWMSWESLLHKLRDGMILIEDPLPPLLEAIDDMLDRAATYDDTYIVPRKQMISLREKLAKYREP